MGKHSIEHLSVRSGYSERTLKRLFYSYLPKCPTWHIRPSEKVNLMIDGTYFPNKVCLVLYRDNNIKATQLYRLTDGEWLEELMEDLSNLISMGIQIENVTCDGLSNIIILIVFLISLCCPKGHYILENTKGVSHSRDELRKFDINRE